MVDTVRTPPLNLSVPLAAEAEVVRAVLRDDPTRWLPSPARRRGPGRWSVTLRAGPLARSVNAEVGDVWQVRGALWRRLSWSPEDEVGELLPLRPALPQLDGEIGLDDAGQPVLVFRGGYQPPAGSVGAAFDRAGLRRVAVGTVRGFLDEVADRLTSSPVQRPPAEKCM